MESVPRKVCRYCQIPKDATLWNFYNHNGTRDGLTTKCRDCFLSESKTYYRANREKKLDYSRKHYLKTRAKGVIQTNDMRIESKLLDDKDLGKAVMYVAPGVGKDKGVGCRLDGYSSMFLLVAFPSGSKDAKGNDLYLAPQPVDPACIVWK